MAKKKTAPKSAPAPVAVPAPAAVDDKFSLAFTPAEAKKLAKLLKASDRGKRLDAIRVVSENHGYIAAGGCLLPLLESVVAKKKMEDVVQAAAQVIAEYLVGRGDGNDPTLPSENTLAAMQEAKKKPAKYKLAEVLGNLVLNPDRRNSWNAVRSLRSMAAVVGSLPEDSPMAKSVGAVLLGPGQSTERLCSHFIAKETQHSRLVQEDGGDSREKTATSSKGATETAAGIDPVVPWSVERLYVVDTLGVMCRISNEAIQTVVTSGTVSCLLRMLRSITGSDSPDLALLTSVLVVLFAIAKAGADSVGAAPRRSGAPPAGAELMLGNIPAELDALAEGGAWGAVYDTLKGPCMARAEELQSGGGAGGGKKGETAVSADLATCLDNMARCAEVLRVMAMTGAGLEEEGALEAGIAAMSAILGMQGLPREEAAVANLMTGMVKAVGSIACLSESNRVKICSAGAAPKVLALMAPPDAPASSGGGSASNTSPPDTPHGRLMRKTAEKCLHHLVVSRMTWMADDRALCDTSVPVRADSTTDDLSSTGFDDFKTDDANERAGARGKQRGSIGSSNGSSREKQIPPAVLGPAYLTVDAVLAAANADSIDVRCRAIRLLSRLTTSHRNAAALGVSTVPALSRLVAWWLRTKDDPEAHRTPRAPETLPPEPRSTTGSTKKNAVAAKEEPVVQDVNVAKAALLAAKRLEESDSTRVLRDEALAYALTVMLELAETGGDERAAIATDTLVELLACVLKKLPCTPAEFYTVSNQNDKNAGSNCATMVSVDEESQPTVSATKTTDKGKSAATAGSGDNGNGNGSKRDYTQYAPSHATHGGLVPPQETTTRAKSSTSGSVRPDTSLDLTAATQHLSQGDSRRSNSSSPRRIFCWRGDKSRDPEVALFSPLDWGWDFEVGVSQEPVQPGLVLRAAALRVLVAVVEGYDPSIEGGAATKSTALASTTVASAMSKVGGASAAAASGLSGATGARSVMKHALGVCLDLLSVDMRYGGGNGEVVDGIHGQGIGSGIDCLGTPEQSHVDAGAFAVNRKTTIRPTVDTLSGLPVSPAEELVHEQIRVACLRLMGSLFRLGSVAREALMSVADTHRNIWGTVLDDIILADATSSGDQADAAPAGATPAKAGIAACGNNNQKGGVTKSEAGGAGGGVASGAWTKPDRFQSWGLRSGADGRGDRDMMKSLRSALPYVRVVSVFLLPLRNPDAPITNIMAALVALGRLCREGEHEAGGTQPEPTSSPEDAPLPSSKEGTAGVLVDTLAGAAVGVGALVPLVSIWGCAVAAAGSGELPAEITGMVKECQGLIDYLVRRGHSRESFWSSLPSVNQINEAKAAREAAAAPKKAHRKSKSSRKGSKGKGDKGSSLAGALDDELSAGNEPLTRQPPPPPAGRPDLNSGPNRATWGSLLNARVDDQRTQTYGTTALVMATVTGLETAVDNLLVAGADPNIRGNDGRSSLMCALAQGMDEAARALVEAGADVDAVDLHGTNVLKCAFLCPRRQTMRDVMRKWGPEGGGGDATPSSGRGRGEQPGPSGRSSRRGSIGTTRTETPSGGDDGGRPRSRTRRGSLSVSRSRSRSGSLTVKDRRRSSLGRSVSFNEDGTNAGTATSGDRPRRLSRTSSMSAVDSMRVALHSGERHRRESNVGQPLKTPRGTTVVQGNARMVPYILACGADPNVSSGMGDFPLHWAVTGTELTVRIMNQQVRIVPGGGTEAVCGDSRADTNTDNDGIASTRKGGKACEGLGDTATVTMGDSQGCDTEDQALLKVLVRAGSALDSCNPDGMTALHTAVIVGKGTLAGVLLDVGASPNVSDSLGCLPLHYACLRGCRGYANLASRLLALGMGRPLDKGVHHDLRKGRTRREKLLLDVGEIMRKGLREATAPPSITQHRATRSELLNFVSAEGFTPLHYVCDGRLVGRHAAATILTSQRRHTTTASSSAPTFSQIPASDRENAISDSSKGTGGNGGGGGIVDHSIDDRVRILRWLLLEPELDPKVRVPRGATTLHLAAQQEPATGCSSRHKAAETAADLVRSLIQNGGVNLDALDAPAAANTANSGNSIAINHEEGVEDKECFLGGSAIDGKTLLPDRTPEEDSGSHRGGLGHASLRFSALHYALQTGCWEAADLLLTAGASVRPEGAFPPCLHVACLASAPASLVKRLLDGGGGSAAALPFASGDKENIPVATGGGAAGSVHIEEGHLFCTTTGGQNAQRGSVESPVGFAACATPLFLAAVAGSAELIGLLLASPTRDEVTINQMDGGGTDSVGDNVMASSGEERRRAPAEDTGDVAEESSVWSTEHSPSDGRSPLHAAAAGGYTAAARALLDAEARSGCRLSWVNAMDLTGLTALDLAVSHGNWECAELLASAEAFDMRLVVAKGASSALIGAERTNMAIVDEGSGEASALSALRESNKLIMTLLKRLAAVTVEDSSTAVAMAVAAAGGEGDTCSSPVDGLEPAEEAVSVQQAVAEEPSSPFNSPLTELDGTEKDDGKDNDLVGETATASLPKRSSPAPVVVHHLHPCFAEGVLYSNAKGIFVPDTPDRRRRISRMNSAGQQQQGA